MTQLRVGIIGSGFGMYGLLPAFSAVPECQVLVMCAQKTSRVEAACQRYHVPLLVRDWQKVINTPKLDAVATAVTPGAQYQILKQALQKRLAVFAEKPLAETYGQAQELVCLAEQSSVTHGIDFIFPQIEAWKKLQEYLETKTFGPAVSFELSWQFLSHDLKHQLITWKTRSDQGGGALAFFFSHSLHYMEWLFGPISDFQAQLIDSPLSLGDGEVGVNLSLSFESGVTGKATLNSASTTITEHRLVVKTQNGMMVLANRDHVTAGFTLTTTNQNLETKMYISDEQPAQNEDERVITVRKNVEVFVKAALQKKPMTPSLEEGLRVQYLIEQIRRQAKISYEQS